MNDEEFGPWIEHDGGPRPVPAGTICHLVFADRRTMQPIFELIGPVGRLTQGDPGTGSSWLSTAKDHRPFILRYRVKKPRGLTILEGLLENLPTPTDRVPA